MPKQRAVRVASGVAALVAGAASMQLAISTNVSSPRADVQTGSEPTRLEVADASEPVVANDLSTLETSAEPAPEVPVPEPTSEVPAQAVAQAYLEQGDDGAPNPYRSDGGNNRTSVDIYCESGGNYATNTGNGYYGTYQFDVTTGSAAVGAAGYDGSVEGKPDYTGSTADNWPPSVQDDAAATWVAAGHRGAWPNC